jgi:hypothetical protein
VYDKDSWKGPAVWSGFIAVFFCLIFTGLLCWLSGTLFTSTPDRLAFGKDRWNLVLYLIVAPIYIAFAVSILREYLLAWAIIYKLDTLIVTVNRPQTKGTFAAAVRTQFMFLAVLAATGIFIVTYFAGVESYHLRPTAGQPGNRIYWFVKAVTSQGVVYNIVGYYYIVLNAVLLFMSLLAAACYVSISIEVIRIGNSIEHHGKLDAKLRKLVLQLLAVFNNTYCFGKIIAFAYVLNTLIFAYSPLGYSHIVNVYASAFIVSVIGLYFVPLPRRSLQKNWDKFKKSIDAKDSDTKSIDQQMQGIYPNFVKVADIILGTTAFLAFLKICLEQWGRTGGTEGLEAYLNYADPIHLLRIIFDPTVE